MDSKTIELTPDILLALGSGVADLKDGDPAMIEAAERVIEEMDKKGYRYYGYNFWPKTP
jgi:hypothetical protein